MKKKNANQLIEEGTFLNEQSNIERGKKIRRGL